MRDIATDPCLQNLTKAGKFFICLKYTYLEKRKRRRATAKYRSLHATRERYETIYWSNDTKQLIAVWK
jgi:hypothetical protein